MASLLEKIQVLIAADLNRLVDRALSSNEPAIFQHHLRELQTMQEQLDTQLATVRADIAGMRRRNDDQLALMVQQDVEVDRLLREGTHEEALAAQDRLNQARAQVARLTEQVERLEGEYAKLAETKSQLDARIAALIVAEPEVDGLVDLARARELSAGTAQSLDDLAGAGDPDVARVVDSIRRRLSLAESQLDDLERKAQARGETPEALKRKELESQLEARKARLGL